MTASPSAVLRATATEIRERANAAFGPRWEVHLSEDGDGFYQPTVQDAQGTPVAECNLFDPESPLAMGRHDAEHIASWDPDATLPVADLLDCVASFADASPTSEIVERSLAVANAYNRTGGTA
jgi:hypothetical protein